MPSREGVPETECGDPYANELTARQRGRRAQGEGQQPVGVEEPDAEEQEWDRESQWVEAIDRHPCNPGIGKVCERKQRGIALRAEVPSAEPKDGEGTQRDRDDLDGDERQGRRNDQPQRRQGGEDRVDVVPESRHLLARNAIRNVEHTAVGSAPDSLRHVSEVVSREPEVLEEITHRGKQHDDETTIATHTAIAQACARTVDIAVEVTGSEESAGIPLKA